MSENPFLIAREGMPQSDHIFSLTLPKKGKLFIPLIRLYDNATLLKDWTVVKSVKS